MTRNHNKNNNVCLHLGGSDASRPGRSKTLQGIRDRIKSTVMLYRVYKGFEECDWTHLDQIDLIELMPELVYWAKFLVSYLC